MLTPSTLNHLAHYTCPDCQRPLGRYHGYILQPDELLSLTTDEAPRHLVCAEETATKRGTHPDAVSPLTCVAIVKAAPTSPSARLIRLHPEDATTICLRLFTPERLLFQRHTIDPDAPRELIVNGNAFPIFTLPARPEEAFPWLEPHIQAAIDAAQGNAEEIHELTRHLGWIQHAINRRV